MFSDFDFSAIDSPTFKEDAVREEIIAPIIRQLGYRPTGPFKVQRSKSLIHPFVMIGSKRHGVSIIPDYTLYVGETPVAVLEAKGPDEPVLHSQHVEQAYSYAIHPEIRASHYALCNGRELVVYTTQQWEPLLHVPIRQIQQRWAEVEEALHPRFLIQPELRDFMPDYGLLLLKAGYKPETVQVFVPHHIQMLARVADDLFTACTTTIAVDAECLVTMDLSAKLCNELISRLPDELSREVSAALSRAPFQVDFQGKLLLSVSGQLGAVSQGAHEEFVPLVVTDINEVRFDPSVTLAPYKKVRSA